jgi:hypothetical protein
VAGHEGAGELVEVASVPAVPPDCGADCGCGICDAAGDDDVCASSKCLGDAERAKVAPAYCQ